MEADFRKLVSNFLGQGSGVESEIFNFVRTEIGLKSMKVLSLEMELTLNGLVLMHLSYLLSRTDADLDRRRF